MVHFRPTRRLLDDIEENGGACLLSYASFRLGWSQIPTFLQLLSIVHPATMANVALARVYRQSFEAHPYYTLAFTNAALNALGDAVAQLTQRLVSPPLHL